jgi:sec-independent protein translocase protein TatA
MEWVIILVIVLIVFGVGKLPQIGGAIGKSIKEFRDASKDDAAGATPTAPVTTVDKTADATKNDKVA